MKWPDEAQFAGESLIAGPRTIFLYSLRSQEIVLGPHLTMAEAITLNIGNGAATLSYNEIIYSAIGGTTTESCREYTWRIMLVINPISIGPAFILPYSAWNKIGSSVNITVYYPREGSDVNQRLFLLNYSGYRQYLDDNSILMLLN